MNALGGWLLARMPVTILGWVAVQPAETVTCVVKSYPAVIATLHTQLAQLELGLDQRRVLRTPINFKFQQSCSAAYPGLS